MIDKNDLNFLKNSEIALLFKVSEDLGWDVKMELQRTSVKYTFNTPVGKIRINRWHNNGEYDMNPIDGLFKWPKVKSYIKGFIDSSKF